MPASLVGREESGVAYSLSPHPMYLSLGQGQPEMILCSDPVLDPLFHGAPDLGWEGDFRLAVYSWPRESKFVLVRLCPDGEYRYIKSLDTIRPLSPGQVNATCRWLVATDARRGYNAADAVLAHNAGVDALKASKDAEWSGAAAEKLAWAIKRDLAPHLGGGRFDHFVSGLRREPAPTETPASIE